MQITRSMWDNPNNVFEQIHGNRSRCKFLLDMEEEVIERFIQLQLIKDADVLFMLVANKDIRIPITKH